MLAKRIIPCLDVKEGKVVKGKQFRDHQDMGDILELAELYSQSGADEIVFYDITASTEQRTVDTHWVKRVAQYLDVPFCVAGGIRQVSDAEAILNAGADKISINSPALENPQLIDQLVDIFGQQCIVIGIDSIYENGAYWVCQYTGDVRKMRQTERQTTDWVREVIDRGAGEIVLNCMDQDGMRQGYDVKQLQIMRPFITTPLIASGGAGSMADFLTLFQDTAVDGALAASVFHARTIAIPALKQFLRDQHIEIRL